MQLKANRMGKMKKDEKDSINVLIIRYNLYPIREWNFQLLLQIILNTLDCKMDIDEGYETLYLQDLEEISTMDLEELIDIEPEIV